MNLTPKTTPLVLAIVLRLITSRYSHPLIFPGYFLAIPVIFYAIALSLGYRVEQLREAGWVFEVNGVDSKWYEFWTLFGKSLLFSVSGFL
jgi:SulP family sulfate permease